MASSSDDETIPFRRKSAGKNILDSDDEETTQLQEGNDDFVLQVSDDEKSCSSDFTLGKQKNTTSSCGSGSGESKDSLTHGNDPLHDESLLDVSGSNCSKPEASTFVRDKKHKSRIKAANISDDDSNNHSVDGSSSTLFDTLLIDADIPSSKFDMLKKRKQNIDDEDSNDNKNSSVVAQDIMKKLAALGDSESDIDEDFQNESDTELPVSYSKKSSKIKKNSNTAQKSIVHATLDSELYDAEGSSDEEPNHSLKSTIGLKGRPERKSKTAAKDAMLEIKAESQRLLRQSSIGLPYHMPKQRSLADFLSRRRSSSMPIKGPSEMLVEVWKQIEEREKQAEDFFKSESEDEGASSEGCSNNFSKEENGISEEVSQTIVSQESKMASMDEKGMEMEGPTDPAINSDSSESYSGNVDVAASPVVPASNSTNIESVSCAERSQDIILRLSEAHCDNAQAEKNAEFRERNEPCTMTSESTKCDKDEHPIGEAFDKCTLLPSESVHNNDHLESSEYFELKLSETEADGTQCTNINKDLDVKCETKTANEMDKVETVDENDKKARETTWEALCQNLASITDDSSDEETIKQTETECCVKIPALSSVPQLSLRGNPDDIIDLDEVKPKPPCTPGVQSLIQRFLNHSGKKKPCSPQTVKLSLVSSERDKQGSIIDIKHESLTVVLTDEDVTCPELQKPGSKLKLLKDELHQKMKKQKKEEWQRKQEQMKDDQAFNGEKDDCGMEDEEEAEDEEEVTTESEPEINDVRESRKKKKRMKSAFVDEEAEDDEEREHEVEENESDEDNESCEDGEDNGENSSNSCNIQESVTESAEGKCEPSSLLKRSMTCADIFASQDSESQSLCNSWQEDDDDDVIPAGQPNGGISCDGSLSKSDDLKECSFTISPLTLTMSEKKHNSMDGGEVTPLKFNSFSILGEDKHDKPHGVSKLFSDPEPSTQDNMDDLLELCSGKFPESYNPVNRISKLAETQSTQSDNDLIALCSGKFPTQPVQLQDTEDGDSALLPDSQIASQSQVAVSLHSQATTVAVEDSQDFSLKWNDDSCLQLKKATQNVDAVNSKKRVEMEIVSSDEEDAMLTKEKKKRSKKLDFSDDEDVEESCHSSCSDGEDDHDGNRFKWTDAQLDEDTVDRDTREIMYDSDENEIRPEAFLENEAELSEEEWDGSEDEDEKGLDQIEMEEADKEVIDQNQVREDIIKSHMKNMLDEDRRDVRILQEMLLEDGELHSEGGGRERQFRWKNVDSTGMGNDLHNSDEENADGEDEEEEDAEWRRQRHEREMFLKDQRMKQAKDSGFEGGGDDEVLENSELLQLGKAALHKSRNNSVDMTATKEPLAPKPSLLNPLASPDGKRQYQVFAKRGSFLARGDGILAKLAQFTGSSKGSVNSGAKNSRKFVFTTISPTKKEEPVKEDHEHKVVKRKAESFVANPKNKIPCLPVPVKKGGGLFDHL